MLVCRCSSELSGHRPQEELKKSQPLSVAEGTPKVLILSMLFGAFDHPSPRTEFFLRYALINKLYRQKRHLIR